MDIDRVSILVKKASLELDKSSNEIIVKYGLTAPQYKILKLLMISHEEGLRIVDIERYYSMTHPTAIKLVSELEKKGFAEYRSNPYNARSRLIFPTELVMSNYDELAEAGTLIERDLTEGLTEEERQELIALLKKMLGV